MNYDTLHEHVDFSLIPKSPVAPRELDQALSSLGFRLDDDVYVKGRRDEPAPWQAEQVTCLHLHRAGQVVYPPTEVDRIDASYLLASLPLHLLPEFLADIQGIAETLGASIHHGGSPISVADAERAVLTMAGTLEREWGYTPGEEPLAIFIESTYPRR